MVRRVVGHPGLAIGLIPFRVRHFWMMRDAVIGVVLIEITVHPFALLPLDLVVFRAG